MFLFDNWGNVHKLVWLVTPARPEASCFSGKNSKPWRTKWSISKANEVLGFYTRIYAVHLNCRSQIATGKGRVNTRGQGLVFVLSGRPSLPWVCAPGYSGDSGSGGGGSPDRNVRTLFHNLLWGLRTKDDKYVQWVIKATQVLDEMRHRTLVCPTLVLQQ